MNLEIGCGDNPIWDLPGEWHRLDSRPLPHIDYCQSAVDLSNIPDATYEMVVARDVIEHLGWREIPAALKEWLRVLVPGGALHVETPNAYELALILMGREEGRKYRNESDFEQFNRVMFGHQDYPENTHKSYFTPTWLKRLLREAGARSVSTLVEDDYRFALEAIK